jgi:signal recognition particle subunit SRP54
MFGQITEQFQSIFKNLRGLGKISDSNINDTVRSIRRTLIDADVNFKVVKSFVSRVEKKVIGTKVLNSIKPGEQFIKIVRDELTILLGSEKNALVLNGKPSIILLAGLQGAGKTTSAGKLALREKKSGKSVLLVPADTYRPAAIEQLITLGKSINVPVFESMSEDPLEICKNAIRKAKSLKIDIVIIDSAGRLHIDDEMMKEVSDIAKDLTPDEILFVVDGMTGQDAVRSSIAFNDSLSISGVVLTKMDGDTRGGAAVSIREATGVPIKFIGDSESLDGFQVFEPGRIADRILGFGDIVSLVEKAQSIFDEESSEMVNKKMISNSFDLDDFRKQLNQLKKMGPMNQVLSLMPGMNSKIMKNLKMDDRQINWTEAIINSMTINERKYPENINGSRRLRISEGSGRSVQEVNSLLKQFFQLKKMMKKMKNFDKLKLPTMANFGKFN